MVLRCTACKRKVAYVASNGDLYWWKESDHHEGCGGFDFDAVKPRVAPRYRAYGRTGVQQPAVDITPKPHSAC
jgi:hypothetical protein